MPNKHKPLNVLQAIKDTYWFITKGALENIVSIAYRDNDKLKLDALLARDGEPLDNTRRTVVRDGVAIIPISGPIFPKANLFTEVSGATSTETVAQDFLKAIDNPEVNAIMFEIDSPGGAVTGLSELSDLIFNNRGKKPIVSFVTGLGASAAFFIGSAADKIVIANSALVGSIGTILTLTDFSEANKKDGIKEITFVSKVSPRKNMDPSSKEGAKEVQEIVDNLGQIFVEAVARNRNVSEETVINDFGQGGLLVGKNAVQVGMVDGIATMEETIVSLSKNNFNLTSGGQQMDPIEKATLEDIKAKNPKVYEQIRATVNTDEIKTQAKDEGFKAGVKHENQRIKTIEGLKNPSNSAVVDEIKFDSTVDEGKAAIKILEKQKDLDKKPGEQMRQDAEDLEDNVNGIDNPEMTEETKAENRKKTISNMVTGGNNARPRNLKIFDKVDIQK